MYLTSVTIESVADTGAMFYLLQAPAAATNAGAFFKTHYLWCSIQKPNFIAFQSQNFSITRMGVLQSSRINSTI